MYTGLWVCTGNVMQNSSAVPFWLGGLLAFVSSLHCKLLLRL